MKNQPHVNVFEIDLGALKHNLNYFRGKLHKNTKILGVVKAFGYGHEAVEIGKFLEKNRVDYLAVAYTSEGIHLRKAGIQLPILVLHPQIPNFESLIDFELEPNLYSLSVLTAFLKLAKEKNRQKYPVHLKLNTGLNRLGLQEKELDEVLKIVQGQNPIKIKSLFSHLAASEDPKEDPFTKKQIQKFQKATNYLLEKLDDEPFLHLANTSGVLNHPESHFDMVRLGIGLYGFGNNAEETSKLKNVGTLKSIISQIHEIKKGASLGYNRAFIASKNTRAATLPIGHADGISRQLGKRAGWVEIHQKPCPIIGNVCMDMIMVDVSDIPCKEGDEVILFDRQETVEEWAQKSHTISYEILTGISQRIPRKIIE